MEFATKNTLIVMNDRFYKIEEKVLKTIIIILVTCTLVANYEPPKETNGFKNNVTHPELNAEKYIDIYIEQQHFND